MEDNGKSKIWMNRIISFACGAAIALLIMGVGMLSPLKAQYAASKAQLEEIQNGAPRLLSEAKAFIEGKNYASALQTLDTLLEKQPISGEATEGKKLQTSINEMIKQKDLKWEAASVGLKAAWEKTTAKSLRAQMETDMAATSGQGLGDRERDGQKGMGR